MKSGGPSDRGVSKWDASANSLRRFAANESPIPGIDAVNVFALQDPADAERLRAFLDESVPLNAVVVGASFGGLEMVEALSRRGLNVTVVEEAAQVLPSMDAEMSGRVEAELLRSGTRVLTGSGLRALHLGEDGQVAAVETSAGKRVATDLVLLALEVRPDARKARLGTTIARVFGLDAGMTGLGLDAAREVGFDADSASVHTPLHLLIVYERGSDKLLGAQAVGNEEVGKHIYVLATALHFGATLADLPVLDLAFVPQLSGAKG